MDLEEIKAKKLEELKRKLEEKRRLESIKRAILLKVLTQDARERLARVRLVKPELAEYVENFLIGLYQAGKIEKVDDATLKKLLGEIYKRTKKETNIKIIRK